MAMRELIFFLQSAIAMCTEHNIALIEMMYCKNVSAAGILRLYGKKCLFFSKQCLYAMGFEL